MRAQKFRIVSVARQLDLGSTDTYVVNLEGYAKYDNQAVPYCVANEYICAELARYLRLPVPASGILASPEVQIAQTWFCSLDFNLTGDNLPPVNVQRCVDELPFESAGLLLFDILVANRDRHAGNFSVAFVPKPAQMSVFDHGHALFGTVAGQGIHRLKSMTGRLAITGGELTSGHRHCLLDAIHDARCFGEWCDRIRSIPRFLLHEICSSVVDSVTLDESRAAEIFLRRRKEQIGRLLKQNRAEFKSIETWGLFS